MSATADQTMAEAMAEAKQDVAARLRELADEYRFSGRIFQAALVEKIIREFRA